MNQDKTHVIREEVLSEGNAPGGRGKNRTLTIAIPASYPDTVPKSRALPGDYFLEPVFPSILSDGKDLPRESAAFRSRLLLLLRKVSMVRLKNTVEGFLRWIETALWW